MNKNNIKKAALEIVQEHGLESLSAATVSARCGFPSGSFNHFAKATFRELVDELMDENPELQIDNLKVSRASSSSLRHKALLQTAFKLAEDEGYLAVTRQRLADECSVSRALITHHFQNMDNLHTLVIELAIEKENLNIIAQAVGQSHHAVASLPKNTKQRALQAIL